MTANTALASVADPEAVAKGRRGRQGPKGRSGRWGLLGSGQPVPPTSYGGSAVSSRSGVCGEDPVGGRC